jgi:hypothetical protein
MTKKDRTTAGRMAIEGNAPAKSPKGPSKKWVSLGAGSHPGEPAPVCLVSSSEEFC